jgi:hypothetical protein
MAAPRTHCRRVAAGVTIASHQGWPHGGPQWEESMKLNLSPPAAPVFWISVVLAVLALLGHFTMIPFVTQYQFWIAILAYIVLFVGATFKGL